MVGNPQRTFSKHTKLTTAGSFHPGAICPPWHPVKEYETIFCLFPSFLTSRISIENPQQWGCLNVQVLFVHSVHTHICQKELLRCSIADLTAREHHRQKHRAVCFLCSLSEVVRGGVAGNFKEIYFDGLSELY